MIERNKVGKEEYSCWVFLFPCLSKSNFVSENLAPHPSLQLQDGTLEPENWIRSDPQKFTKCTSF